MKENYFTRLCSFVENGNENLEELLHAYQVPQAQPRKSALGLTELKTLGKEEPYTYSQAQVNLKRLMQDISRCDNPLQVYNALAKKLTPMGIGRLLGVLLKNKYNPKTGFVEEVLGMKESIGLLFKDRPYFNIKVVYNGKKANGIKGCYSILLYDPLTQLEKEIVFESKESKALYLWFLQYPRQEISKSTISGHIEDILNIYDLLYPGDERLEKKVYSEEKNKNGRDGFSTFFMQAKSTANRDVQYAVGIDDDVDWYTIDFKDERYAISLMKEKIEFCSHFYLDHEIHSLNIPQKNRGV